MRREKIPFTIRLHGLRDGLTQLPRPPPFDSDAMEPIEPSWLAIKDWIPGDEPDRFNQPRLAGALASRRHSFPDGYDQSPAWQASEVPRGDGYSLVLEIS